MEKVVHKYDLHSRELRTADLRYWLSRTPEERLAAVEFLRRLHPGSGDRLQKVVRVVRRRRG